MDGFQRLSDNGPDGGALSSDLEVDVSCAAAIGVPVLISAGPNVAEWLARLIHTRSERHTRPFVVFRPGHGDQLGLVRSLIDGTAVRGGTLLVADVAAAAPHLQALLRDLLAAPQPDTRLPFRLIAATSADLFSRVVSGEFDHMLFYRLNKIHIHADELSVWHRYRAGGTRGGFHLRPLGVPAKSAGRTPPA